MKSVLVYCGSKTGNSEKYSIETQKLAQLFVDNGFKLIFGGGNVGLMGILSNTMLDLGGEVVGVIPQHLVDREVANNRCTELIVVKNMQERKVLMEEMADCIATLPGGYGSMDELFESLTNVQLGLHEKPISVLNTDGFYDSLLVQINKMAEEGFLLPQNRDRLLIAHTPEKLIELLNLGVKNFQHVV